jgi:cold shock CspA family protein
MLWFNDAKGYGFIRTEDAERLYVSRDGFEQANDPPPRCKGRAVSFDRVVVEGDTRALRVAFVVEDDRPRARLRHPRGASSL